MYPSMTDINLVSAVNSFNKYMSFYSPPPGIDASHLQQIYPQASNATEQIQRSYSSI